jgi:hypothetical protein
MMAEAIAALSITLGLMATGWLLVNAWRTERNNARAADPVEAAAVVAPDDDVALRLGSLLANTVPLNDPALVARRRDCRISGYVAANMRFVEHVRIKCLPPELLPVNAGKPILVVHTHRLVLPPGVNPNKN